MYCTPTRSATAENQLDLRTLAHPYPRSMATTMSGATNAAVRVAGGADLTADEPITRSA